MGLINIFSKKKDVKKQPEQIVEDYYTPVEEPVGELPVGTSDGQHMSKFFSEEGSNNNADGLIFDDDIKPSIDYSIETKQLIDNNYYLSTPSNTTPEVNPTASLFMNNDSNNDGGNELNTYYDEEIPVHDDEPIVSNVDGSYSNMSSETYEDNRVNEHKFFSTSLDEINDNDELNQDKTKVIKPITASSNIWSIGKIDDNNKAS